MKSTKKLVFLLLSQVNGMRQTCPLMHEVLEATLATPLDQMVGAMSAVMIVATTGVMTDGTIAVIQCEIIPETPILDSLDKAPGQEEAETVAVIEVAIAALIEGMVPVETVCSEIAPQATAIGAMATD